LTNFMQSMSLTVFTRAGIWFVFRINPYPANVENMVSS